MIKITPSISLKEEEIVETFIHASGPGGQNVNKVSTAVQLRFDVSGSNSLPDGVKRRLRQLAGKRMTKEGVIVLTASNSRIQRQNREAALNRLIELIRKATIVHRPRIATKPTPTSQKKRVDSKIRRGEMKRLRSKIVEAD